VLGSPIAHSKSPLLHRAAFAALGMESSEYSRFELRADELEGFLDSHPDHIGFSLTMPLKDRLVTLAVERGWNVDDTAALTAAGNTLVRRSGQVEVANTDVRGIVRAIAPHMEAEPHAAGGAGAGRATILWCRSHGRLGDRGLPRSRDRPCRLPRSQPRPCTPGHRPCRADRTDRLGGGPDPDRTVGDRHLHPPPPRRPPDPVWDDSLTPGGVALDVAYSAESAFLAAAAAHGLHPVDGTAMLVEQAVAQFEMFLDAARAENPSTAENLPAADDLSARVAAAMYAALADPPARAQD
jgi:shikimate dehydrogenase